MINIKKGVIHKTFPVDAKLWARLKKEAKEKGMKLYNLIHVIIEEGLNNGGK